MKPNMNIYWKYLFYHLNLLDFNFLFHEAKHEYILEVYFYHIFPGVYRSIWGNQLRCFHVVI